MVARPVQGKEKRENEGAMMALKKEWDRLRAIKTWNEDEPEEYWTVLRRLRGQGKHGNFARIFDICVEKNSELDEDDPRRKYKGRVVYGGNRVWDEYGDAAMFEDVNSCPSTMEAAKSAYAYGLFKGNTVQTADATQAYTQAGLDNSVAEHWGELPPEQWPDSCFDEDGNA